MEAMKREKVVQVKVRVVEIIGDGYEIIEGAQQPGTRPQDCPPYSFKVSQSNQARASSSIWKLAMAAKS